MNIKKNRENIEFNAEKIKKIMASGDVNRCYEQILLLENKGDEETLEILIDNLSNNKWLVRKMASEAIYNCGPWVVKHLREGLFNKDQHISYWIIQILKRFKRKGHQLLLDSLDSVPYNTRYEIVRALGEVRYGPAIDKLVELFSCKFWEIRRESSESLVRIGKKAIISLKNCFSENIDDDSNLDTCYWALRTMARIMGGGAVPFLEKFLESSSSRVRLCAVMALGDTGDEDAVEILMGCFNDSSLAVRQQSVDALKKIGGTAVQKLKSGLGSNDPTTKMYSFQILSKTLGDKSIGALKKIISNDTNDMKLVAIGALSEIKTEESAKICSSIFNIDSWLLRSKASETLLLLGNTAVPILVDLVENGNDDEKYWSLRVLAEIGGFNALSPLFSILKNDALKWRIITLNAMEKCNDKLVVASLSMLLGDRNWSIRKKAAKLLSKFGVEVIEPIILLNSNRNEGIGDVVYWAARVVHDYGQRGEKKLISVMNEADEKGKYLSLSVMCALFTPAFQEAIIEFLAVGDQKNINLVASTVIMNGDSTVISELLTKITNKLGMSKIKDKLASALRGDSSEFENVISVETAQLLVNNYYNSGSNQYFEKLVEFFILVEDREILNKIFDYLKSDVNRFVGFIISVVSDSRNSSRCRYFLTKMVSVDREFYKILKNILDDMVAARDFRRLEELLYWDDPATAVFAKILAENNRDEVTSFLMEIFRKKTDCYSANEILLALCRKFSRSDNTVRNMVRAMLRGNEDEYLPIIVKAMITDTREDFIVAAVDFLREIGYSALPGTDEFLSRINVEQKKAIEVISKVGEMLKRS